MRFNESRLLWVFALLGCASTTPPAPRSSPPRVARVAPAPTPASNPSAPATAAVEAVAVRATAPESLEFNITASSDLPVEPASTAQPYERIVERAVAPARGALAECLRSLGAPARRVLRVTVEEDGSLLPRPPQDYALGARDARCVEGVLRAVTVEPSPPRVIPYDVRVEVAR